jgi:hypothetical protein
MKVWKKIKISLKNKMPILSDGIRLARLRRSIGRDHTEPRPLSPFEVASFIQEMKDDLNTSSNTEVAERLGLKGEQMVKDFLSLLDRPSKKFDDIWGWGKFVPDNKIGFSMGRRLGAWYANKIITADNYERLVSGVLNEEIPTVDAEEILYLKKKNPGKTFEDCCKEIGYRVPEVMKSIVFISDLDLSLSEKISKIAKDNDNTSNEIAESLLSKYFEGEQLEGILIKNDTIIKIAFSEKGREELDKICKKDKISRESIINHLLLKEIQNESG